MKTLFFILIAYLVYVVIRGHLRGGSLKGRGTGASTEGHVEGGEEMVQDPVCKSYIPISTAIAVERDHGRTYFCSTECRDKYLAEVNPEERR